MSLTINHNMAAMTAARLLSQNYGQLSTSVQRLSSGLRINSAADDAAGLAVREMMRTDISTLNQGVRNANDAISMIQTADGALSVIDEKLTRMKELAEQASTGTYTTAQRLIMDSEFQAMASEITRIANATNFNGVKLLNGSLSGAGLDGTYGNQMKVHFGTGNSSAEDYYYVRINGATASALGIGGSGGAQALIAAYVAANSLTSTTWSFALSAVLSATSGEPGYWATDFSQSQTVNEYRNAGNTGFYYFAERNNGSIWFLYENNAGAFQSDGSLGTPSGSTDIKTQANAQQMLGQIDSAIVSKDTIRASLGAMSNRLSNTVTQLTIQAENLQSAESQISDVDVATEMTNFTRNQILVQAGVSMLAQANSLPQLALRLLGA